MELTNTHTALNKQTTKYLKNIIITGTPGTGKSTICKRLSETNPQLNFINISDLCIANNFISYRDDVLDTKVVDEEKLKYYLSTELNKSAASEKDSLATKSNREKGKLYMGYNINVIESHMLDYIFDSLNIEYCFVLSTDLKTLKTRLTNRKYNLEKIKNNLECEIFEVLKFDAERIFGKDKVVTLVNNRQIDIEKNSDKIIDLLNINNL